MNLMDTAQLMGNFGELVGATRHRKLMLPSRINQACMAES